MYIPCSFKLLKTCLRISGPLSVVLKVWGVCKSPIEFVKTDFWTFPWESDSAGLGWKLRFCMFNKLPGDAGCFWSVITLWVAAFWLFPLDPMAGGSMVSRSCSKSAEGLSLWCLASTPCPDTLVTFQVCWGMPPWVHGLDPSGYIFLLGLLTEPSQPTLASLLLASLDSSVSADPQSHSLAFSVFLEEFFTLPLLLQVWRKSFMAKQIKKDLLSPLLPTHRPLPLHTHIERTTHPMALSFQLPSLKK